MKLSGTWKGAYTYPAPRNKGPVPFEMMLSDGLGNTFTGTVQDDAIGGGHPEPGVIAGRIFGDTGVKFEKVMPSLFLVDPDGGSHFVKSRSYKIQYEGRFDGPDSLKGTWTIRGKIRFIKGSLVVTVTTTSDWSMTRVSS